MTNKWVRINDDDIRSIWECPDCDNYACVGPEEYADIGTPVCSDCECDMEYSHTEINNG